MDVSVIIPVRNLTDQLIPLINSVTKFTESNNGELVIVLDGKNEKIKNALLPYFKQIHLVELEEPSGSYIARNSGIKASFGKNLIFIDADIQVSDHALEKLVSCLLKADYVAGNIQISKKDNERLSEKFYRNYELDNEEHLTRRYFGATGFLGINRKVIETVGLFSESFFSGGDFEFGQRVKDAGFTQSFCNGAVAFHPPKTFKEQFKTILRIQKGRAEIYKSNPQKYTSLKPGLLSVIKNFYYLVYEVIFYKKNKAFKKGEMGYFQYVYCIKMRYFMEIMAKMLVLLFPHKKFNY